MIQEFLRVNWIPITSLYSGRIPQRVDSGRTTGNKHANKHENDHSEKLEDQYTKGKSDRVHKFHPGSKQQYLFIVYSETFSYNFFSIIWSSNQLRHTAWRGKEWSHTHSRYPILALDINGCHIKVFPTLTTNSSTKAFFEQYIFPKLQV